MPVTVEDILALMRTYAVPDEIMNRLDPKESMAMQGVDSLALSLLAMGLRQAYGIELSVEDGLTLRTVADVAALVNSKAGTN